MIGLPPPPSDLPPLWMLVGAFWYGLGLLVLGPYFVLAYPDYDGLLLAGALVYALLGGGLVYFFARDDAPAPDPVAPRIAFDTDRLVRGMEVAVRVELLADYTLVLDALELGLAKSMPGQQPTPQDWLVLAQDERVEADRPLVRTGRLTLPAENDRSSWELLVRVRAGRRQYLKAFPIAVQSPSLFATRA